MVKFYLVRNSDNKITKFYAEGHSGYSEIGSDIVYAAISALSQNTVYGIVEYLKIDAKYFIGNEGYLALDLNGIELGNKRELVDTLLETMAITLKNISQEYPKNLKLIEKEGKQCLR